MGSVIARVNINESAFEKKRAGHFRVLLVDDNPAIIDVVSDLLGSDFEIVGSCCEADSVLREISALKPDVIILDISIGETSGIELARRLQDVSCKLRIVFLTVHEEAEFVRTALAAGGSAYVFKSRLYTDLVPAINAACDGKLFVSCRNSSATMSR